MRNKRFLIVAVLFIQVSSIWGQQMNLYPASISPGSYVITATAGVCPGNPTTNNTSQSVQYNWRFNYWQTRNITVESSTTIPSGLTVTVRATGDDGTDGYLLRNRYGTGDVTITVTSTPLTLISGIWSTNASIYYGDLKTITRPLIQNITISDFSKLHPGTYPITLIYVMQ